MNVAGQSPDELSVTGEFERQPDEFRAWIRADGSTPLTPDPGRYHLYVSLACPWAHRTLIVRHLKRLDPIITASVVDPVRDERGWAFRDGPGYSRDPVNGFTFLSAAYLATKPEFQGRWSVPVLWDRCTRRIVNNSEDDICRMFNHTFTSAATTEPTPDLFPAELEPEHKKLSEQIYNHVNNGVYRAGFASQQPAYEQAVRQLFATLDRLEARLAEKRYLFGPRPIEADWRLFCTLVRFEAVYHGHFKCNLRRIADYPNLHGYLHDLYQIPGISATVDFDHIKRHYYMTHPEINPTRIVPLGPLLNLSQRHGRESLG
jgi:putative glutathione S-transferase